ncbi:hypothetical protein HDU96_002148 [Phlyctochytrium bullatum]|nr:hypothetical protein HDU96_002148 [Phlyctochytrium bullatum]
MQPLQNQGANALIPIRTTSGSHPRYAQSDDSDESVVDRETATEIIAALTAVSDAAGTVSASFFTIDAAKLQVSPHAKPAAKCCLEPIGFLMASMRLVISSLAAKPDDTVYPDVTDVNVQQQWPAFEADMDAIKIMLFTFDITRLGYSFTITRKLVVLLRKHISLIETWARSYGSLVERALDEFDRRHPLIRKNMAVVGFWNVLLATFLNTQFDCSRVGCYVDVMREWEWFRLVSRGDRVKAVVLKNLDTVFIANHGSRNHKLQHCLSQHNLAFHYPPAEYYLSGVGQDLPHCREEWQMQLVWANEIMPEVQLSELRFGDFVYMRNMVHKTLLAVDREGLVGVGSAATGYCDETRWMLAWLPSAFL